LVVPVGVELEVSQQLSAGRDDPDVQVVDQDVDGLGAVAAAEADVVQAAVVPQGDLAVGVDGVVSDAVVPADEGLAAGGGLGSRLVGLLGGLAVQGPVRAPGVVVAA
jgi:hypothetical protein